MNFKSINYPFDNSRDPLNGIGKFMLVLSKCWHCADNVDIRWNVQYKSDTNFSCNSINRVFKWMTWIQLSFFLVFNLNLLIIDTLETSDLSQGRRDKNNGIFIIFEKNVSEQITATIVTLAILIAKCQNVKLV